uniref:HA2 domain-containing protein n=1 Tax=Steinernema glaseri TaxID=37863 RepID=A0A1I7ZKL0_9BILA
MLGVIGGRSTDNERSQADSLRTPTNVSSPGQHLRLAAFLEEPPLACEVTLKLLRELGAQGARSFGPLRSSGLSLA